jgi:hypothetical protein
MLWKLLEKDECKRIVRWLKSYLMVFVGIRPAIGNRWRKKINGVECTKVIDAVDLTNQHLFILLRRSLLSWAARRRRTATPERGR